MRNATNWGACLCLAGPVRAVAEEPGAAPAVELPGVVAALDVPEPPGGLEAAALFGAAVVAPLGVVVAGPPRVAVAALLAVAVVVLRRVAVKADIPGAVPVVELRRAAVKADIPDAARVVELPRVAAGELPAVVVEVRLSNSAIIIAALSFKIAPIIDSVLAWQNV